MPQNRQLILRPADPSEAAGIASMSRIHIEHGLRWRWTTARVRRQISDRDSMVLVASLSGERAGFAIMKFGDLQAHLYLLAVEPRYRKAGIGKSMLRWLETSCDTAGIQQIRLEVRSDNRAALEFYRKLGYLALGKVAGYYERRESAIIMGKNLLEEIQAR